MPEKLSKVPRFKLNNRENYESPGKNSFNRWRKITTNINDTYTDDVSKNKQLPWMSLYKDYKDLLQIDLVTTVGYVEDPTTNKWSAEFIRGFPLLLQGPSTQFNPINGQDQINSTHWESGWNNYYQHVEDFSGNLQAENPPISDFFDNNNKIVITDFNNDETRNLLILDFDDDGEGEGFYLYDAAPGDPIVKKRMSSPHLQDIHKKSRPKYIVVRIDKAVEESAFNGNSEWGLVTTNPNFWQSSNDNATKKKLYVFNYVYSGYVISPYDFMANFTTDYLRAKQQNAFAGSQFGLGGFNNSYDIKYFINFDDTNNNLIQFGRNPQPTIQLIKNNGDIDVSDDVFSTPTIDAHDTLIAPFRYNFHLFPNAIEIEGLKDNGGNYLVQPAASNQPIFPSSISNVSGVRLTSNRMNTINFQRYDNYLYSRAPQSSETSWSYYIENIIWSSLSTARHTLYAASFKFAKKRKNYLGNYLNINELTYDSTGQLDPETQNPDFAPKSETASGVIIREHNLSSTSQLSSELMYGINEINMARKTVTPYYKVETQDDATYNYENYAFNWNDTSKSWTDIGTSGIDNTTEKIDVSNHVVVEYRNLVRLKTNIKINYKFHHDDNNNPVKTTFLPANKTWLNNTQLSNNDVQYVENSTGTPIDESNTRLLSTIINSGEYFEISWEMDNGNVPANTKKYGYLLDVASGRHDMSLNQITFGGGTNTWINDDAVTDIEKAKYKIISNVYQIRIGEVEKINENININNTENNTLNFSLDTNGTEVALYKVPTELEVTTNGSKREKFPFFGYLNFIGINNSELIGNAPDYRAISIVFKAGNNVLQRGAMYPHTRDPYFKISNSDSNFYSNFNQFYQDSFNMYYNANLFYARTSFIFSNINIEKNNPQNNPNSQSEILFLNESPGSNWKSNNDGLDITNISSQALGGGNNDKTTGIKFYIYPSNVELFIQSLIGKVSTGIRTFNSTIDKPSILLNNDLETNFYNIHGLLVNIKLKCLKYDIINFCGTQLNAFIPDFWKWSKQLVESVPPNLIYNGPPNIIPDRNLNNRYNVYNWKINPADVQVDNSIYATGQVHNPQFAFENQTLIHYKVEVSTIKTNFSHILVNTWRGAKNNKNKFQSIGLKSEVNENEVFEIVNNPVTTIEILGGNQITPNIIDAPVILDIDPTAKFNYATDDTNDEDGKSKAPRKVSEGNGQVLSFTTAPFTTDSTNLGWFAETGYDTEKIGIFAFKDPNTNTITDIYQTNDLSANVLELPPTNITLKTSDLNEDIKGTFSTETQEFPFELLFCYPIEDPPIQKPEGFTTSYQNSNNEITTTEFVDYKGYKRYSNLYAISLKGSNNDGNNVNFKNRKVFPNTVIINCVELPPPVQVNNTFDMVAHDNRSVKIVWKGYNFSKPQGDFRSKYGNSGDIVWKIVRFQTQLGITKTLQEKIIFPDSQTHTTLGTNYNLSTYTFIDNDVRIYDKYIYTISGTFVYNFKRTSVDLNSTTLSLSFGSFSTPEVIICKNNAFEYGRYNTTSTNLKLFRPLLINKDGGQKDKDGKQTAGGLCLGNIFAGSTRISSTQNIYANTTNQLTKKQTYVLLSKQQFRPFR